MTNFANDIGRTSIDVGGGTVDSRHSSSSSSNNSGISTSANVGGGSGVSGDGRAGVGGGFDSPVSLLSPPPTGSVGGFSYASTSDGGGGLPLPAMATPHKEQQHDKGWERDLVRHPKPSPL
jgi:hypothetical protein